VAEQLKATQSGNIQVLEALADKNVQNKNPEGQVLAIRYLEDAIFRGATNAADFEELAKLLVAANRQTDAVSVLRRGIQLAPYDAELYRISITTYFALNKVQEACEVAATGKQRFPQDGAIRALMNRCDPASAGVGK
jgi:tetratricopeptide (TPR) repeat protein